MPGGNEGNTILGIYRLNFKSSEIAIVHIWPPIVLDFSIKVGTMAVEQSPPQGKSRHWVDSLTSNHTHLSKQHNKYWYKIIIFFF